MTEGQASRHNNIFAFPERTMKIDVQREEEADFSLTPIKDCTGVYRMVELGNLTNYRSSDSCR
jgi:hypothetical protein